MRWWWMCLLAGCAPGWEGIWLLRIPYVDDPDLCETVITENYTDAEVPPEDDPVGEWTYDDELESSDALYTLRILNASGNNFVMVLLDAVYEGSVEGGVLTAGWTDSSHDTHRESHTAGYVYAYDITSEVVETITLERNGEVDGASGTYRIQTTTETTWTETDEWPAGQTGVSYTQIPSFLWLEGAGNLSTPQAAECGGDCSLTVSVQCDLEAQVTALYAGHEDDGAFAAIEDAGQDGGATP